jgi:ABC-2 type transport system permease protein
MIAIFQKELTSFFSSLIGYIAIAVFLILIGLIMWVFPNNALDFGYANLDILFDNAPLVFMLLIPAVTMRLFSEEKKAGTLEIVSTRPITELEVILGKYFAALLLVTVALIPTLLYYYSISQLASPVGNLDVGAIRGSYIGLFLLSAVFVSIGLFASALTDNQIVAFILAAFLSFIFYMAFNALSGLGFFGGKANDIIQQIGIQYHYASISRGIVDSRDVIYFISLIVIFILSTKTALDSRKW